MYPTLWYVSIREERFQNRGKRRVSKSTADCGIFCSMRNVTTAIVHTCNNLFSRAHWPPIHPSRIQQRATTLQTTTVGTKENRQTSINKHQKEETYLNLRNRLDLTQVISGTFAQVALHWRISKGKSFFIWSGSGLTTIVIHRIRNYMEQMRNSVGDWIKNETDYTHSDLPVRRLD